MLRQFEVLVTRLTDALIASWDFLMASSCDFLSNESATRRSLQKGEHRTARWMYWQSNWHPHLLWHFAPTLATYCGWCKCWSTVAARFAATVWDCAFLETRIFQECHGGHFTSLWIQFLTCSVVKKSVKTTVSLFKHLSASECLFDTYAPHFGSPTASMITAMDNQKPGSSNLWTDSGPLSREMEIKEDYW